LGAQDQPPRVFTFRVNRDILRAAVFLCKTPFDEALAIAGTAMDSAAFELSRSFVSKALNADLTSVLILDFIEVFLRRFFRLCLLLFSADRCEANGYLLPFHTPTLCSHGGPAVYPGRVGTVGFLNKTRLFS